MLMKIGVMSDSHLQKCEEGFALALNSLFADCEMIFHAGDFVDISIAGIFPDKEFNGVCGNMDKDEVRRRFPVTQRMNISGKTIVLIHDLATLPKNEIEAADCVVFGHTHNPVNLVSGGVLFFNPGASLNGSSAKERTVGILEVGNEVTGEIIEVGA